MVLSMKLDTADGHAKMIEPPMRSSMWRFGFDTPINYNDNELFCGGIEVSFFLSFFLCFFFFQPFSLFITVRYNGKELCSLPCITLRTLIRKQPECQRYSFFQSFFFFLSSFLFSEWVKAVMSFVVLYSAEQCPAEMNRCLTIQKFLPN